MNPRAALLALALISAVPAFAAPWENESLRIKVNLPGSWKLITPKVADQRMKAAADSFDVIFYGELKKRTEAGNFFVFEKSPKSKVRADLQSTPLGKPLRPMTARDIKNLCPLWAKNHDENEMPFQDCQPRKLGIAWTALLTYQPEPGSYEYQVKYFRTDGTLILFTVAGKKADAEAIFRNAKFY